MPFVIVELDKSGKGDNRPLGVSGSFLTTDLHYSESDIAEFRTTESATDAASRATNRRPGYELFVPGARKVAA